MTQQSVNPKHLTGVADSILKGERLLPPEALSQRWGIKVRTLKKYWSEGHSGGFRLPVVWMGNKPRFRLVDVAEFEERCARHDHSRKR